MRRNAVVGVLAAVVFTAVGFLVLRRSSAPPRPHHAIQAAPVQAQSAEEPEPPKAPPPVARAPSSAPAPRPSASPPAEDDASLLARLREVQETDPELAVALARDGNLRFPDSPDAPERTSILIHALSALGRWPEGRGVAEDMVNRYPDSTWVREIEAFTGAHRHRNARVDADGQVHFD